MGVGDAPPPRFHGERAQNYLHIVNAMDTAMAYETPTVL
jgi:hypothetical protein